MTSVKWTDPKRDAFNKVCGWIATVVGLFSLAYALRHGAQAPDKMKYLIVGFWTLVPPIYFWWDWTYYCNELPAEKAEGVKHMHDLSRNIWIALVVILVALFDLKVFRSG